MAVLDDTVRLDEARKAVGELVEAGLPKHLALALDSLAKVQSILSAAAPDGGWVDKDPLEVVRTYAFSLCDEVHELAKELHWKPWKQAGYVDRDKVLKEYGDVLAFLGIMTKLVMLRANLDASQLARAYVDVTASNLARFEATREAVRRDLVDRVVHAGLPDPDVPHVVHPKPPLGKVLVEAQHCTQCGRETWVRPSLVDGRCRVCRGS